MRISCIDRNCDRNNVAIKEDQGAGKSDVELVDGDSRGRVVGRKICGFYEWRRKKKAVVSSSWGSAEA